MALLGLSLLAAVGVGALTTRAAHLEAKRTVATERTAEGSTVAARLTLRSRSRVPVRTLIHQPLDQGLVLARGTNVEDIVIAGHGEHVLAMEIETPIRGVYGLGEPTVTVEDPFGMARRELPLGIARSAITVLPIRMRPRLVGGRRINPLARPGRYNIRKPGQGTEFFAIREYVPGDPLRTVNWKASARTLNVMVNQYESEEATRLVCLADHRLATGVGPFRSAPVHDVARAAALALKAASEGGDTFILVPFGRTWETIETDGTGASRERNLTRLAELEPDGDVPLEVVVREALHTIRHGSKVLIASPLVRDPTITAAVAALIAAKCWVSVAAPPIPDVPGLEALREEREANLAELRSLGVSILDVRTTLQEALHRERVPL